MRAYAIDELEPSDIEQIREYLSTHAEQAALHDLYLVEIPEDLLSAQQFGHKACRPFCFAVELGEDSVRFELLVRSKQTLHCECIGYATKMQRDFIISFADRMLSDKNIRT